MKQSMSRHSATIRIFEAEEKAETAKDREKPTERPSLKEKLELMKGKAAELSAERKEAKPHVERGDCATR